MSIEKDLRQAVSHALGFALVRGGTPCELLDQNSNPRWIHVEHLWVGMIDDYFGADIILAGVRYGLTADTCNLHRASLLVEKPLGEGKGFLGQNPYRFVELGTEPDPVTQTLEHMNVFLRGKEYPIDDPLGAMSYVVETESDSSSAHFLSFGKPISASGQELWTSMLDLCQKLTTVYADPELIQFFMYTR